MAALLTSDGLSTCGMDPAQVFHNAAGDMRTRHHEITSGSFALDGRMLDRSLGLLIGLFFFGLNDGQIFKAYSL